MAIIVVVAGVLAITASACWLTHDYSTCEVSADCRPTQECVDRLCQNRPEFPLCGPVGSGLPTYCPPSMTCDTVAYACRPSEEPDAGLDMTDDVDEIDVTEDMQSDPGDSNIQLDTSDVSLGDPIILDMGCTEADECDNGLICDGVETCQDMICVRQPLVLADSNACTEDLCTEEDGPTHPPIDSRCNDDNVCTQDSCAPELQNSDDASGCFFDPLPDGQSCGGGRVCVVGACVEAGCGNGFVEVARGEACDDGNERGGDGCDVSCSWEPRVFNVATHDPDWSLSGMGAGDAWGAAGSFACADFDGDTQDDLIIWSEEAGTPDRMELRLFLGPLVAGEVALNDATWTLTGLNTTDPAVTVRLGDVNDDQRVDILISDDHLDSESDEDVGAVMVFYGQAASSIPASSTLSSTGAGGSYMGLSPSSALALVDWLRLSGDAPLLLMRSDNTGDGGGLFLRSGFESDVTRVPSLSEIFLTAESSVGGALSQDVYTGPGSTGEPFVLLSDPTARRTPSGGTNRGRVYYFEQLTWPAEESTAVGMLADIVFLGPDTSSGLLMAGPVTDFSGDGVTDITLRSASNHAGGFVRNGSVWLFDGRLQDITNSVDLDDIPIAVDRTEFRGAQTDARLTMRGLVELTGDAHRDLILYESMPRRRLVIAPYPITMNETIQLSADLDPDNSVTSHTILGGLTTFPTDVLRCDLDGDSVDEYAIGIEGDSERQGGLWVYEDLAFATYDPFECYALPTEDTLSIPGTFSDGSPVWQRPEGDNCPGSSSGETPYYAAYTFCNRTGQSVDVDIRLTALGREPSLDPYLVIYEGRGIPEIVTACLHINDDVSPGVIKDAQVTNVSVDAGEAITVVSTSFDWDVGDYQLIIGPSQQ